VSLLKYQPFYITAMKKMLEGDASQCNRAINKNFCKSKATTMTSLTYFEGTIYTMKLPFYTIHIQQTTLPI